MSRRLQQFPRPAVDRQECPCTSLGCPRHGLCCQCMQYHRKRMEIPVCYFSEEEEKTYNRTLEFYSKRRFK
ncbi:MAG: DUF6485 family protein [Desulfovibrionales bacterium]